jgi:hypothetical protein
MFRRSVLGSELKGLGAFTVNIRAMKHDPKLIAKCSKMHKDLIVNWSLICESVKHGRLSQAQGQITIFGMALKAHLSIEDEKFYAYMDNYLYDDEQAMAIINEFRSEMKEIGRELNIFIATYARPQSEWAPEQAKALPKILDAITVILLARIEREESTLYPLYHP